MFDMYERRGKRKLTQIEAYDLVIGLMSVYMRQVGSN